MGSSQCVRGPRKWRVALLLAIRAGWPAMRLLPQGARRERRRHRGDRAHGGGEQPRLAGAGGGAPRPRRQRERDQPRRHDGAAPRRRPQPHPAARVLLEYGADATIGNQFGTTAAQFARKRATIRGGDRPLHAAALRRRRDGDARRGRRAQPVARRGGGDGGGGGGGRGRLARRAAELARVGRRRSASSHTPRSSPTSRTRSSTGTSQRIGAPKSELRR